VTIKQTIRKLHVTITLNASRDRMAVKNSGFLGCVYHTPEVMKATNMATIMMNSQSPTDCDDLSIEYTHTHTHTHKHTTHTHTHTHTHTNIHKHTHIHTHTYTQI